MYHFPIFDPIYGSLLYFYHYISKKIMEICLQMQYSSFKNYNFHKSLKSHKVQQGSSENVSIISQVYIILPSFLKIKFVIIK